jgi:hypothetical protein
MLQSPSQVGLTARSQAYADAVVAAQGKLLNPSEQMGEREIR